MHTSYPITAFNMIRTELGVTGDGNARVPAAGYLTFGASDSAVAVPGLRSTQLLVGAGAALWRQSLILIKDEEMSPVSLYQKNATRSAGGFVSEWRFYGKQQDFGRNDHGHTRHCVG